MVREASGGVYLDVAAEKQEFESSGRHFDARAKNQLLFSIFLTKLVLGLMELEKNIGLIINKMNNKI